MLCYEKILHSKDCLILFQPYSCSNKRNVPKKSLPLICSGLHLTIYKGPDATVILMVILIGQHEYSQHVNQFLTTLVWH